ncbi:MAG: thioredoxin domain-containing protein [Nibricoccus sp.]
MPNRLAQEKSPYLLQHADNPVNWLPWGEDAFAKARTEQKPIFLSIGYSTCHWCHVMAHESFENTEVAAILNQHFVAIKVDREERPDVDRVYMAYVQAATGHGGWPLSAWLTPQLKPFYGGTYFPPEDWNGRHGFKAVLRALAHAWETDREKIEEEGERVIGSLRQHFAEQGKTDTIPGDLSGAVAVALGGAFQYFHEYFDGGEGGFGGAPKFPRASNIDLLLRFVARAGQETARGREALAMAELTLQKMAKGGIRDHVGGGFHRYSVDDEWFVPHFEKMLYDQAQIAANYLEAFRVTGREAYAWVARDTLDYVLRDLRSADGGFFSAEDADSLIAHGKPEHAEGAFYLWTQAELEQALGEDARLVCAHFDVEATGNVSPERDAHEEFVGKNILRQRNALVNTAGAQGISSEDAEVRLSAALLRLREVRAKRPRPHLDDKIVTAWNGLAISALAKAGRILGEPVYEAAATRAAEFLQRELYDERRGILFRSHRQGRGAAEGFAEDYAFLIEGLLDLYETTFETRWLQWAQSLQAKMNELLWDEAQGGYFNSAAGDANLLLRLKEEYDGAEPAPSSVAISNLVRLAPLSGDEAVFMERARRTGAAFQKQWSRAPQALPRMLCSLELVVETPGQVVLTGDPQSAAFRELLAVVDRSLGPRRLVFAAKSVADWQWLVGRAPWLQAMNKTPERATAYVCEHYSCKVPVTSAAELHALLK